MKTRSVGSTLAAGAVAVLVASVLFPFAWMLFSSFKPEREILQFPPTFWPNVVTLVNYLKVWDSLPLAQFFLNTVVFSVGTTLLSVLFDSMAGYAFARIRFRGRHVLFVLVLTTMMIPFQVVMIPLFIEIFRLGLLDTYWGLILPRASSAFGIFLMRSFFVSVPKDLEESGRIDGLSEYRIFRSLMLPLCGPAMLTLGIFHLMNNWNDLLYPLMLTSSSDMRTLSAGLAMFVGDRTIEYGPTLAASVISLVPLLVAYLFAQKYFVQSIATTGLKD